MSNRRPSSDASPEPDAPFALESTPHASSRPSSPRPDSRASDSEQPAGTLPGEEPTAYTVRNAAKALLVSGERVLLTKEFHADGTPFWTLPGGGVEPRETFGDCLRRELLEELRCRVSVGSAVSVLLYYHRSVERTLSRYTVFGCRLRSSPRPNPSEGIADCAWVRPDDLPSRTLPQVRQVVREAEDARGHRW
jgi:8-oxo-dGTP diphosphatase